MDSPATLRIEGEMTISFAAEQRERLLAGIAGAEPALALDLSGVEAIDSAGVQLLLATRRSLAEQQRELSLPGIAPCVIDGLRSFGLEALFRTGPGGGV